MSRGCLVHPVFQRYLTKGQAISITLYQWIKVTPKVLQQAMQIYHANFVLDTPASARDVEVDDAELSIPAFATNPQAQPQERTRSVKVQAKLDPTRRTQRIQVRFPTRSIAIQCKLLKPTVFR